MAAQHTDKQGYNALYDEGVALGRELQEALTVVTLHPHPALTAVYQVLLRLVLIVQRRQFVAQIDEHLVLIHPIIEILKFLDDLVLQFIDRLHHAAKITQSIQTTKAITLKSVRYKIGRASCRERGVDLGGRRIIKKKNNSDIFHTH